MYKLPLLNHTDLPKNNSFHYDVGGAVHTHFGVIGRTFSLFLSRIDINYTFIQGIITFDLSKKFIITNLCESILSIRSIDPLLSPKRHCARIMHVHRISLIDFAKHANHKTTDLIVSCRLTITFLHLTAHSIPPLSYSVKLPNRGNNLSHPIYKKKLICTMFSFAMIIIIVN